MQRIFNVSKWRRLVEGGALNFESSRPRVVRLEVNSRVPVGLYLLDMATGEALFLATTCGRDTVEFHCGGSFTVVSDNECFIYTADGESIHAEAVDPVIFTRIAERRSVSPEIQAIQRTMNANIDRRLAAQRAEFEQLLARLDPRAIAPAGGGAGKYSQPSAAPPPVADQADPVVGSPGGDDASVGRKRK